MKAREIHDGRPRAGRLLLAALALLCLARGPGARAELASWYGADHRGRPMADGRPFDPAALTCASWDHPLGTRLRVTRRAGRPASVLVTVTDRGPARRLRPRRHLDLSHAAFARLADPRVGLLPVRVERVGRRAPRPPNP